MTGEVKFYDEATAWGLILGADGALYVVRGGRLLGAPLRIGDTVIFEPQPAPGGPRATAVRRLRGMEAPRSGTI
ncbi:MAG TPA: hypothetical protein VGT40_08545 [Methylomirabilota bacterium]|jgi:cold shock CspA family protein|nr:hypothetical protein [Methylomirabilota bacterium]